MLLMPSRQKHPGERFHLDFSPSSQQWLETDYVPFTGGGSPLSFMYWFKGGTNGNNLAVLAEWGDSSGSGHRITNRIDNGSFRIEVGGNAQVLSSVNDGPWHHICCVYNGNGNLDGFTVYIDGNGTNIWNSQSLNVQSTYGLQFAYAQGFAGIVGSDAYLDGQLDDIRVFSRELTGDEVVWNKDNWLSGREPDLELWLAMEENDGTPVDRSPNKHSVTAHNSPTWKRGP